MDQHFINHLFKRDSIKIKITGANLGAAFSERDDIPIGYAPGSRAPKNDLKLLYNNNEFITKSAISMPIVTWMHFDARKG